jgi:hypothetical protein
MPSMMLVASARSAAVIGRPAAATPSRPRRFRRARPDANRSSFAFDPQSLPASGQAKWCSTLTAVLGGGQGLTVTADAVDAEESAVSPAHPQAVRGRPLPWLAEVWPFVVVVLMVTIEIRFLAHSTWRPAFLDDGDSLTLPLLWQSLMRGDPMHPVMSSQLMVFPEGPIYALAFLCSTSVAASLMAVAYINIGLFYTGVRAIAATVVRGSVGRRQMAALCVTGAAIAAMLLERTMSIDATTVVTPLLFDDFYGGVVLMGLASVAFACRQLTWPPTMTHGRRVVTCVAVALLLGVTTDSDALFALAVTGPFLAVVVLLKVVTGPR